MTGSETKTKCFYTFLGTCMVCMTFAVITIGAGHFRVEAKRAEIEAVKFAQKEKTERTEERSQFWQKLIPWGKDEAE